MRYPAVVPYYSAMNPWHPVTFLTIILSSQIVASEQPKQQDAFDQLRQATSRTDIFALPSFEMKANTKTLIGGKHFDGTYQLQWNGPDQWREEVSFPGYSEIQIGGKGTVWVQRSADFVPDVIFNLHNALGFGSSAGSPPAVSLVRIYVWPSDSVTGTHSRKDHGEKLECVEMRDALKRNSESCILEGTGTLGRVSGGMISDGRFSDFGKNLIYVGAKVFPKTMTFEDEGRPVASVEITELLSPVKFSPESFTPPGGAPARAGCMNPQPAHLVKRYNPQYPPLARSQHLQGKVAVEMTVGIDGVPQARKAIESPGPDFSASAIDAVEQWRYRPASCNDQPVETEIMVEVNYTLIVTH